MDLLHGGFELLKGLVPARFALGVIPVDRLMGPDPSLRAGGTERRVFRKPLGASSQSNDSSCGVSGVLAFIMDAVLARPFAMNPRGED